MFTWYKGELPSSKRLEKSSDDLSSQNEAHQAASPSAPLQSRGHKRQFQEEDDHTESLKTKRQNPSTQGSPADEVITISLLSDDDDEVIILNPPPDRGYGKRSAGHRKKTGSKK